MFRKYRKRVVATSHLRGIGLCRRRTVIHHLYSRDSGVKSGVNKRAKNPESRCRLLPINQTATCCRLPVADGEFFQVRAVQKWWHPCSDVSRRNSAGTSPCFHDKYRRASLALHGSARPPASRRTGNHQEESLGVHHGDECSTSVCTSMRQFASILSSSELRA